MSGVHEIVCWQPVLTEHQSYTLEAMGWAARAPVTVYVDRESDAIRAAQGWSTVQSRSLNVRVLRSRGRIGEVRQIVQQHRTAVHVFGSPFEEVRMICALLAVVAARSRVYLLSEPYAPIPTAYFGRRASNVDALKAILRPALYRLYGALLRKQVKGVFAISPLAATQYAEMGISRDRIFPFGYFVPPAQVAPSAVKTTDGTLRVVYVGSLIARKGVDILVAAARLVRAASVPIEVDIYGPGVLVSADLDDACVTYRGVIPFGDAQKIIGKYDALVVPSRHDGWGVVVNEAVLAGVPVICSDRVGASAVVAKWGCGRIFRSEDPTELAGILGALAGNPASLMKMSAAAVEAGRELHPTVAGQYMARVILGESAERPQCPWYDL